MARRDKYCCGPQRLSFNAQVIAYLLITVMLSATVGVFLAYFGGSFAECEEKPEWCAAGTPRFANFRFLSLTTMYFLVVSLLHIPLTALWTRERSLMNLLLALALCAFTSFLLSVDVYVFAGTLEQEPTEVTGFMPVAAGFGSQALFTLLMFTAHFKTHSY